MKRQLQGTCAAQRLLFAGRELPDHATLAECGVSLESTLDALHTHVLEGIEDFLVRQPGDRPRAEDDPEGEGFAASFLAEHAAPRSVRAAASEAYGGVG